MIWLKWYSSINNLHEKHRVTFKLADKKAHGLDVLVDPILHKEVVCEWGWLFTELLELYSACTVTLVQTNLSMNVVLLERSK